MLMHMTKIGEESGMLDDMLEKPRHISRRRRTPQYRGYGAHTAHIARYSGGDGAVHNTVRNITHVRTVSEHSLKKFLP
jgi:hypothetical protein